MATPAQIQLEGFKEVRKAVRGYETDTRWQDVFKPAFGTIASAAESGMRASAGASRMGHVATNSIKGRATQTAATVKAGQGVPWFAGHNFGSIRYRQFPPKATPDYHLYAWVERNREQVQADLMAAISAGMTADGL